MFFIHNFDKSEEKEILNFNINREINAFNNETLKNKLRSFFGAASAANNAKKFFASFSEQFAYLASLNTEQITFGQEEKKNIFLFFFKAQIKFLLNFVKQIGNKTYKSYTSDEPSVSSWENSVASALNTDSVETWEEEKYLFLQKLDQMQNFYETNKIITITDERDEVSDIDSNENSDEDIDKEDDENDDLYIEMITDKIDFLKKELDHFSFLKEYEKSTSNNAAGLFDNIDSYLDAVYMQYQLENEPLTFDEASKLSEKLLHYQIQKEDCTKNDPFFKFLTTLAGFLDLNSVERLLEDNAFENNVRFEVGTERHVKIKTAVYDFLKKVANVQKQNAEGDEDDEILSKNDLKMYFKRFFISALINDAESSGVYVILPAAKSNIEKALIQLRNQTKNQNLTLNNLLKLTEISNYFAQLVAANMIETGVLCPRRWVPKDTLLRALIMKKKALFHLRHNTALLVARNKAPKRKLLSL